MAVPKKVLDIPMKLIEIKAPEVINHLLSANSAVPSSWHHEKPTACLEPSFAQGFEPSFFLP